ncbi:10011_t:CDS:1, partial [Dentiscutata heterogama]
MRALHIFTFAIAIFISVDALPYDKPNVLTIPLKPKSITRRRLSKREIASLPLTAEQSDVTYFGQITFGTGTPQNFDIMFDTGSPELFVIGKDCNPEECSNDHKYDSALDKSFSLIKENAFIIKYADGTEINGDLAKTTIVIADMLVEQQEFGLANKVSGGFNRPFSGIMGMPFGELNRYGQPTVIANLINNNKLDNPQFSFMLGREADRSPSELTIGGSNPARYHADTLTFTHVVDDNDDLWEIPIDDCIVGGQQVYFDSQTAIIDTGTTRIYMPPNDAKEFYREIRTARDRGDGFYAIDCKAIIEVSLVFSGKTWNISPKDFIVKRNENVCVGAVAYFN